MLIRLSASHVLIQKFYKEIKLAKINATIILEMKLEYARPVKTLTVKLATPTKTPAPNA